MREIDHREIERLLTQYPTAELLNRMGIVCRLNAIRDPQPLRRLKWKAAAHRIEEAAAAVRRVASEVTT